MTAYVDDAAIEWRGKARFHMTADSLDELHAFASTIGVRPCWFHRGSKYPHYDITAPQRDTAIAAGARAVTSRELLPIAKALAGTSRSRKQHIISDTVAASVPAVEGLPPSGDV
jgi:hypothetical protein